MRLDFEGVDTYIITCRTTTLLIGSVQGRGLCGKTWLENKAMNELRDGERGSTVPLYFYNADESR